MFSFYNNQFAENPDFANRAFRYGDGLFETIRIMRGEFLFFHEHLERMFAGLSVLGIELSKEKDLNYFYSLVCELMEKNHIVSSARVRIQVWRSGEGFYQAQSNNASILIEINPMDIDEYVWNDNGLSIGFSERVKKSYDVLANIKSSSALIYVVAAMEAKQKQVDEIIVLNAYDKIADATSSNIFIVKDKRVITPSLRDGGVAGVFRHHLMEVLKHFKYAVTEQTITKENVMEADEIFLTNVIRGIQPVTKCGDKKFATEMTREIFNLFNKQLLEYE